MKKDKVLIVDDDESMCDVLEAILKEDYSVLKARSGEEALKKLSNHDIGVILLDIRLPGISGIETLEQILKKDPDIKCLMLSAVHDADTIVECMRKGAYDYMTKEFEYETVLLRVRNAMALAKLKKDYNRQVRKLMMLENRLNQGEYESKCQCGKDLFLPSNTILLFNLCREEENLTEQEQKVVGLIFKGCTNMEIAHTLHIKLPTVKTHLMNAFQKLGVTSRSQAIAYLLRKGSREI